MTYDWFTTLLDDIRGHRMNYDQPAKTCDQRRIHLRVESLPSEIDIFHDRFWQLKVVVELVDLTSWYLSIPSTNMKINLRWLKSNTIWDNAMLRLNHTNQVREEYTDLGQYGLYTIPSKIMPCYCFPASLVNQHWTAIDCSSFGSNYVLNKHDD